MKIPQKAVGRRACVLSALVIAGMVQLSGQTVSIKRITCTVSYVTFATVYVDAGSKAGLAIGDTLTLTHVSVPFAKAAVYAVSSNSSATTLLTPAAQVAVGDSAFIVKEVAVEAPPPVVASQPAPSSRPRQGSFGPVTNSVAGSFALQYVGAGVTGSQFDFSQPSALLRLTVSDLFGTGAMLSINGRGYYDASQLYSLYGQGSRMKVRMYDFSLSYDDREAWYGYSVGRVTSRYVTGLGSFDGAQFFMRRDNVSAGFLLGTQPDLRTSGVAMDEQRFAAFVNYNWQKDVFNAADVTLAYGQQLYQGRLDRDFAYVQSSARLGSQFFMFQNSEFDFHKEEYGIRSGTFRLTNTFLTLSYMPLAWLNASAGYDATRNIYLFESMSSIPDTLLDQRLQQGFRTMITFQPTYMASFSLNANYRLREGVNPPSRTLGGAVRLNDILGSRVTGGVRYADIVGIWTRGHDITADLSRWFSPEFSVGLRYDRYSYLLVNGTDRFVTTTGSADINVQLSRLFYTLISVDRIWDTIRNSVRVYSELGVHF